MEKSTLEIVRKMKTSGCSTDEIVEYTDLSPEAIEKL